MSDSLTSLISSEPPERIAHDRSFPLSSFDLSDMSEWTNERNPSPGKYPLKCVKREPLYKVLHQVKKQHFKVKFWIWGSLTWHMTCVQNLFKNHSTLLFGPFHGVMLFDPSPSKSVFFFMLPYTFWWNSNLKSPALGIFAKFTKIKSHILHI